MSTKKTGTQWPAAGLLEFKSIARGIMATDAMIKKAPVTILESHPISPGKYMTLICGDVADVDESLKAGIEIAGDLLVNNLFLPQIHHSIIPALSGTYPAGEILALGILETFSVASCVVAADIAAKASDVRLVKIRLANGLGGKAYFVITGKLSDVQSSLESAASYVKKEGLLIGYELIQNPHPDLIAKGAF
jgi:microcompartment protein CcmL/EutN